MNIKLYKYIIVNYIVTMYNLCMCVFVYFFYVFMSVNKHCKPKKIVDPVYM